MNCDDYLAMLSTLPVEELSYGHAREHAAVCRDCHRVTRVVAERERNMYLAYGDLSSSVPAAQAAAAALAVSGRRRTARWSKVGLGLTALATIASVLVFREVRPTLDATTVHQSFELHCLSPVQAAELLRPQIGSMGSLSFHPDPTITILNVEATEDGIAAARSVLERFDNASASKCARR